MQYLKLPYSSPPSSPSFPSLPPSSPIPYPLSPIPYPLSPIPYPLSPIPYPLSPIPYPLSPIPYPLSPIPSPLSPLPSTLSPSLSPPLSRPLFLLPLPSHFFCDKNRYSSINKMTSSNLALVFSPTLRIPGDLVDAFIKFSDLVFAP